MKKINEMSHEEIVNLSEKDLERLIHYEMAENGIPILPEPIKPDIPQLPKEDSMVYTAEALGVLGFTNKDECLDVLEKINACSSVTRASYDYSYKSTIAFPRFSSEYDEGANAFNMKTISCRSYSQVKFIKDVINKVNELEAEYKKDNEKYKKSVKDSENIRSYIYGVLREHKEMDFKKEYIKAKFKQYLELAEGHLEIALSFLGRVETLDDDMMAMLREYGRSIMDVKEEKNEDTLQ